MPDFELNTCYRKTNNSTTDNNAIKAWQCHVIHRAMEEDLPVFKPGNFDDVSYKELARLSQYKAGPQIAAELLRGEGIHLVYAQHLPHTRLDGAAFLLPDGHPVIAMTLRYDRLDNYWFTLFHELHHVLHDLPNHANAAFMDDTENPNDEEIAEMERNADIAARNVLIPPEVWNDEKVQALLGTNNSEIVKKVAFEKRISSAVLAGRLRKESNKYYLFQDLLGKCRAQLMSEENNETDNKKQEV